MTAARILAIADSDAIRLAVVTALSTQGFEVSGSADGEDLEARLPRDPPDLVILDVMLPGGDGFELLRVIRRSSPAAVLVLTARDGLTDRLRGLTQGADDYLIKPFAMAELVARIHGVLRRSEAGGSSVAVDDLVKHVALQAQQAWAVIDIFDAGPGVTPADRERIFERLLRLDHGRAADRGGAGLGLAIARGYARAHGGDLTCEDPRGTGALFRLTLPLAAVSNVRG
jgi:DNA-binding response OmpR family regulator